MHDRPYATALGGLIALAASLGIGRFAYALVLPDMRDSLGWSYSAAGFMNTINAAGYLAGALAASRRTKNRRYPSVAVSCASMSVRSCLMSL